MCLVGKNAAILEGNFNQWKIFLAETIDIFPLSNRVEGQLIVRSLHHTSVFHVEFEDHVWLAAAQE